jgi:hypothetical protein
MTKNEKETIIGLLEILIDQFSSMTCDEIYLKNTKENVDLHNKIEEMISSEYDDEANYIIYNPKSKKSIIVSGHVLAKFCISMLKKTENK